MSFTLTGDVTAGSASKCLYNQYVRQILTVPGWDKFRDAFFESRVRVCTALEMECRMLLLSSQGGRRGMGSVNNRHSPNTRSTIFFVACCTAELRIPLNGGPHCV